MRKEDRELIRSSEISYPLALVTRDGRFPLLNGIDPYVFTNFNRRQMFEVLAEAERALQEELTSRERASLEVVAELCRKGARPLHQYLWFIGE